MLEKLKAILKTVVPEASVDEITAETRLVDDLAFDSLSMMLLLLEIEKAFGFRFEKNEHFETVGQVCDYIKKKESK